MSVSPKTRGRGTGAGGLDVECRHLHRVMHRGTIKRARCTDTIFFIRGLETDRREQDRREHARRPVIFFVMNEDKRLIEIGTKTPDLVGRA